MGIRNLTKLIKRRCPPEIIQSSSLEAFRNKTLALDGNLLMQRFHHGNPDHPPLLLWYRFLMSLRQRFSITPVCIFDGPTRLPQKAKELAKRQASRDLMHQRAAMERERSDRIDQAAMALSAYQQLPKEVQQSVSQRLREQPPLFEPLAALDGAAPEGDPASVGHDADTIHEALAQQAAETSHDPLPLAEEATPAQLEMDDLDLSSMFGDLRMQASTDPPVLPTETQQRLANTESMLFSDLLEYEADDIVQEDKRRLLEQLQFDSAMLSQKYANRTRSIDQAEYDRLKILIEAMGIPLLTTSAETPHEAEALGAVLQASGLVDAVVSEDSDVLLYDATMLRNALGHKVPATLVNGKAVREALGFDREQFIDMCLLCGSDFAETLPGIGPVKAYELIKEHGSIEAILQSEAEFGRMKHMPPDLDGYLRQVVLAREVFQGPPCPPADLGLLEMKPPSPELPRLLVEYGLEGAYVPDGVWDASEVSFSLEANR